MRDQSPPPSQIVFPVAIQLPEPSEPELPAVVRSDGWGWVELFVLSQVFWGVLLFVPGSQAYRTYIRAFPYVTSLSALMVCARSSGMDAIVPGARWIIAVMFLLVANLVHDSTWLVSGMAQIVFQLAIAAPVFWGAKTWVTVERMERLLWLICAANFASAAVGLLQVYYPATFMPPDFNSMALKFSPEFVASLTYTGAGDRTIIRPPGLTDLPGGAAISGTIVALLGFAFAVRPAVHNLKKAVYFGAAFIGITVLYLTQVRSLVLMIVGCIGVMAFIRLRQGRVVQSGWIAGGAAILILGSFIWAVSVGGEAVHERFLGIMDQGVVTTYQENRGLFLDYTLRQLPFEYPLGAGLGRWGMMSLYFGDTSNWQHPALYAEIQPTGWIYDGGVLLLLLYPAALGAAVRYAYKRAVERGSQLNDLAMMVLILQVLIAGLCLTGPAFNTQLGIMFWLPTAMLVGCERTLAVQAWHEEEQARDGDPEGTGEDAQAHELAPVG